MSKQQLMDFVVFYIPEKVKLLGERFIDSTQIEVCHPCRSKLYRVFEEFYSLGARSLDTELIFL